MKIETKRERELVNYYVNDFLTFFDSTEPYKLNEIIKLKDEFMFDRDIIEPKELENGKLYVLNDYPNVKVIKTGVESGFGFNANNDFDNAEWNYSDYPESWREATSEELEEFKQQLYKEAERRGYNKPNAVISFFTDEGQCNDYKGDFMKFHLSNDKSIYIWADTSKYSGVSCIMNSKGEWADITFKEELTPIKKFETFLENMRKQFEEEFLIKK